MNPLDTGSYSPRRHEFRLWFILTCAFSVIGSIAMFVGLRIMNGHLWSAIVVYGLWPLFALYEGWVQFRCTKRMGLWIVGGAATALGVWYCDDSQYNFPFTLVFLIPWFGGIDCGHRSPKPSVDMANRHFLFLCLPSGYRLKRDELR